MSAFISEPCDPPVHSIAIGRDEAPAITERMRALFAADQAARQSNARDWDRVASEDAKRRYEILRYLTEGQLSTPESLYHAAFILQHGNCPEHYELAHQLAEHAVHLGYGPARWLWAATLDRSLMSRGLPQKYGTQYRSNDGRPLELYQYDPTTTDEERQHYDVPPLHELLWRAHVSQR